MNFYTTYKTDFGNILLIRKGEYLTHIYLDGINALQKISDEFTEDRSAFSDIIKQLDLYFKGELRSFDIKIKPEGTEFQKKAWQALLKIPYGKTISYKDQAVLMESPNSTRAVGNANGRNPIPIVIPCHRVIKNDGSIGGFSSGIEKKLYLLDLEKKNKG